MDEFDTKTPIYGWESLGSSAYVAYNTGSVTQLFQDGKEFAVPNSLLSIGASSTAYKANITHSLASVPSAANTLFNVFTYNASFVTGDEDDLRVGDYISIWKTLSGTSSYENAYIESINTSANQITVRRAALGTTAVNWPVAGDDLFFQDALRVSRDTQWFYDSYFDQVSLYLSTDPNDLLIEAGEDFATLITRIMKNSSRYVDSRIDAGIPRDAFKDKEGNYDYFLVRTASLVSIYFLINAHTPGTEVAEKFLAEANFNIDQINTGKTKLSYQVTGDSASGVLREVVAPQAANALYIVDTRGHYSGIYDLMKIVISTAGAIGTAKYDVYHGDSTGLKKNKVVDAELITGKYQSVGSGLQVRFAGSTDASVATLGGTPDEWELECWGQYESLDDSPGSGTNTRLTRRSY